MSSGSKHTVLSVIVLSAAVTFTITVWRLPRGPVHIVVPQVPDRPGVPPDPYTLRVCADPNNLPFSNERGEGFENRIANLVAAELGRRVQYYWQPQRRGFIRTTLAAGECDVVVGVPSTFELARVTRPYYRSSFMFVSRHARRLGIRSLDDRRLRTLRIGIQITGEDYGNPPPAQALAMRHITDNVYGYTVYGDYSAAHPSWGVLDAVTRGDVDVAIAWGPLAGYVASQAKAALDVVPVPPGETTPALPLSFDISMGVRRDDAALASALNRALMRRAREIQDILTSFGVPVLTPREEVRG